MSFLKSTSAVFFAVSLTGPAAAATSHRGSAAVEDRCFFATAAAQGYNTRMGTSDPALDKAGDYFTKKVFARKGADAAMLDQALEFKRRAKIATFENISERVIENVQTESLPQAERCVALYEKLSAHPG